MTTPTAATAPLTIAEACRQLREIERCTNLWTLTIDKPATFRSLYNDMPSILATERAQQKVAPGHYERRGRYIYFVRYVDATSYRLYYGA